MKEYAIFAGGCFWCTEAVFQNLKGVLNVMPGYAGGLIENPSYEQVSTGQSGHAEAIQITFNPKDISYKDLLYVFFRTHNPTTINRQGNDIGSQYRSMIFYFNEKQRRDAEEERKKAQDLYKETIITEVSPHKHFYPAEEYHRQYYLKNKSASYCQLVIDPKLEKLKKDFKNYIK